MARNLGKLGLLRASYSLDFGSCFTFNLLKCDPKYCLRRFFMRWNYISLFFFFNLKHNLNDAEQVVEEDIFAQTAAIPQWHVLDQTECHLKEIPQPQTPLNQDLISICCKICSWKQKFSFQKQAPFNCQILQVDYLNNDLKYMRNKGILKGHVSLQYCLKWSQQHSNGLWTHILFCIFPA